MKQIEVTIMGQSYVLGCPEGGETALLEAVDQVDREMSAIRDGGKVRARERIAVLAALNLAYALTENSSPGASSAPPSAITSDAATAELDALIARIDSALREDGQLL
jgi:cell division protein ZapA